MSRKVTSFRDALSSPKTVSQFKVFIPFLWNNTLLVVESATYPTEETGETSIWHKGQQIFFPTFSKVPGTWSCVIPEDMFATNQISIDSLRNIQAGNGKYVVMYDIFVTMLYGQTKTPVPTTGRMLKSSFLLSVDPINFDASKPDEVLKWKLTFRYNYIEPVLKFPY